MKKIYLIVLVIANLHIFASAQCPEYTTQIPQLHGLVVTSSLTQDPLTKIFTYRYSVRHDTSSTGCIIEFEVDITYPPNRDSLQSIGLTDYPRHVIRNLGQPTGIKLIPVGIPTLPNYKGIPSSWVAIIDTRGKVSWGAAFDEVGLEAGGRINNLMLTSYGLPTLRSFTVKPKYSPPPVSEGEVTEESFDTLRTIQDSTKRVGVTIGPTAPPFPFDSLKFLDTLKSYTTQSRSLGWIASQPTANKYTALFDSIRAQILRGNGLAARMLLDSVVVNANRDSSGAITSEAYALLRFNSEYLKSHLPTVTTEPFSFFTGWNMVSVPVEVSDFRKIILYPAATSQAFAYTGAYAVKETLKNGSGYWVKFGPNPPSVSYKGLRVDSMRVPVIAGWNMIGSVSQDIYKSRIRFEGTATVSSYFGYSGSGYSMSDTIKSGKGYWIKLSQAGQMVLGAIPSAVPPITPDQPPPSPGTPSMPTLVSPANGSIGQPLTPTVSWNVSSGATSYRLQVSTSSSFSTLVYDVASLTTTSQQIGGLGYITTYYWRVNASNESGSSNWSDIWWFTTQDAPAPPPCTCCIASATSLDQLTVTDANGNGQSMFARNKGRALALGFTDDEMPPEPRPGTFHARFGSNKFIESIPPSQGTMKIPILVKNAQYPVILRWNIKPENKTQYWLIQSGQPKKALSGSGSSVINNSASGTLLIEAQATVPCQQ